ncbi:MAG: nuclear transport factor 2 family protein [Limosilactobacillus sp.]
MATTDEETIAQLVRAETTAMINKDIDTLKKIISPTAKLFHITGVEQSRDEWLNQIKLGRMHYFGSKEELFQVVVKGNHAEVISRNQLDARIYGFRNTWPLQSRTKLEKIGDRWLITESHASMY